MRDGAAGLIGGVVSVTYAVSFAALIFDANAPRALGLGVGVFLVAAVAGALVVGLLGRLKPVLAGPDTPVVALLSVTAGAIAQDRAPADAAAALLTLLVTAALVTGGVMLLLGHLRLGSLARFVPFPVIGGFFGATGILVTIGGLHVILGGPVNLASLHGSLTDPWRGLGLLAGLGLAGAMVLTAGRLAHRTLPLFLLGGTAVALLVVNGAGVSMDHARAAGLLLDLPDSAALWVPLIDPPAPSVLRALLPWWGDVLVATVVASLAVLMNTSGLERELAQDTDINKELRANGWANLAAGLTGGAPVTLSANRSLLLGKAGGLGRTATLTAGLVCLALLAAGPSLLSFTPRVVLGAVLMFLGLQTVLSWLVLARHRLSRLDMAQILVIVGSILWLGYAQGFVVGIILACASFIVAYSRLGCLRHALTGAETSSAVDRSPEDSRILRENGVRLRLFSLTGYLFFGSANRLLDTVRGTVDRAPPPGVSWVILDFTRVSGMDSSAVYSFTKLDRHAQLHGWTLVLAGLSPDVAAVLEREGFLAVRRAETADRALEWCEDRILQEHAGAGCTETSLHHWLTDVLARENAERGAPAAAAAEEAAALMAVMTPVDLAVGDHLVEAGAPSDRLFLMERGRISVVLSRADGPPVRLRSMVGRGMVGEMGFFRHLPRSATIVAEDPSRLWSLDRAGLETLQRQSPDAAAAFMALVVRTLSDRLDAASATIAALQRTEQTDISLPS